VTTWQDVHTAGAKRQNGSKMPDLPVSALVPILVVALLLPIAFWVHADAKALRGRGTPVVLTTGFLVIDTPEMCSVLCLIAVYIFFPIYMMIRRQLR
jgi:hypothetical protein